MFETDKLSKEIDFNNLIYYYTGKSAPNFFVCFKGPLIMYDDIKNSQIGLQKEEKTQKEIRSELKERKSELSIKRSSK